MILYKIFKKTKDGSLDTNKDSKTMSENEVFKCSVSKLKFDSEYKGIYKQNAQKVSRIAEDMRLHGYDNSQPIIINPQYAILDGYSRYDAIALLEGLITDVPVVIKNFKTRDEYIKYILHLQMDRRSSSDRDKYQTFINYMELKEHAKVAGQDTSEYTEEKLANKLSVGKRQISMLKEISKKITPELLEKLESEEFSLNQIYSIIKKTEKSDTVPSEKQINKINLKSFRLGVQFALVLSSCNKTPLEIMNNERIADGVKTFDFTDDEKLILGKLLKTDN